MIKGITINSIYPHFRNSILWNNQDSNGTEAISSTVFNIKSKIVITNSLVQGTGGSDNWILDPSIIDGGNNIDTDPLFVSPIDPSTTPTTTGNLRLKGGSPAIDTGEDAFVSGITTDLDGNARIVDGDRDGTATVDMGAYETQVFYYLPLVSR